METTTHNSTVALVRCKDYSPDEVSRSVNEALSLIGGIAQFVQPGKSVLLKPNLISTRKIETAATTHPEVVKAVARAAMAAGGKVGIGDSPGVGNTLMGVAKACGMLEASQELGVPLVHFDGAVQVERPAGARYKQLELAKAALETDCLINIPKMKTHQQMFLTLAVKNHFGCIVGNRKLAWHLSAGRDPALFARMIVEICLAAKPKLHIMDAVIGMEGTGPTHGQPKQFGFIAASADPFAMDTVLTSLMSFEQSDVPIFAAAEEARKDGLPVGETRLDHINVVGECLDALRTKVKPPAQGQLLFVPKKYANIIRRLITVHPSITRRKCKSCGKCVETCPARAMNIVDSRIKIDDNLCIRCFCCQELCPHGAVDSGRGLLNWICK